MVYFLQFWKVHHNEYLTFFPPVDSIDKYQFNHILISDKIKVADENTCNYVNSKLGHGILEFAMEAP